MGWYLVRINDSYQLRNGEIVRIVSLEIFDDCCLVGFSHKIFINGGVTDKAYYELNGCYNKTGISQYDFVRKVV